MEKHSQLFNLERDDQQPGPSRQINSGTLKEERKKKLEKFTKDFVKKFEEKLAEFTEEAKVGGTSKTGKMAEKAVEPVATAVALGLSAFLLGAVLGVAKGVGKSVTFTWKYLSGKEHRTKAKRVVEVFGAIGDLREALVKASVEIFRSFECQFINLTDADGSWARAMEKLAVDAVNRILNYVGDKYDEQIIKSFKELTSSDQLISLTDLLTRGVILGKSNKGTGASIVHFIKADKLRKVRGVPEKIKSLISKPGHTIKKGEDEWKTSDLYEEVGLVKISGNGDCIKYYRKKNKGSIDNADKYGYRRCFKWEDDLSQYEELEKRPVDEYKYVLKQDLSKYILDNINKDDPLETGKRTETKVDILVENKFNSKKIIIFDVRDPVAKFTGRKRELSKIHKALQRNQGERNITVISQTTSISGLGGIGKTQLARQYILEYRDLYDNIIWINAETQESLKDSFHRLAKQLKIPSTEKTIETEHERNLKDIVNDVYASIDNTSLFIFDNAEGYKDIKDFLPLSLYPDKKLNILITSRNQKWEHIIIIPLGIFTPEEAEEFIRDALNIKDGSQEREIKALAKTLQYFPLALQQAVAYIKEEHRKKINFNSKFDISDYLEVYEIKAKTLLGFNFPEHSTDDYSKTVLTTWRISINKIIEVECYGPTAKEILDIIAYMTPENIPTKMFLGLTKDGNEDKLCGAIELLKQYSMINSDKNGFSNIHRLVQQVIRLEINEDNKEEEVLRKLLSLFMKFNIECADLHTSFWNYASKHRRFIEEYYVNNTEFPTLLHFLAETGNYKTLNAILEQVKESDVLKFSEIIDAEDNNQRTALLLAVANGHLNIVTLLLESGANMYPMKSQKYKLKIKEYEAARNILKALWKLKPQFKSDNFGLSIYLIKKKKNLRNDSYLSDFELHLYDFSILHLAASEGYVDIVQILIDKGANINHRSSDGFTPLHAACRYGHIDVVRMLISKGANVKATNVDDWTILDAAIQGGHLDVVKYLITNGKMNINIKDKEGITPLHTAAYNGKLDVVEYLLGDDLQAKADINAVDIFGATPIFYAAMNNSYDIVKFMLTKNATVFNLDNKETLLGGLAISILHFAAAYDELEIVEELVKKEGVSVINLGAEKSLTPMHFAALFCSFKVVEYLIKLGADTNNYVQFSDITHVVEDIRRESYVKYSSMPDSFCIYLIPILKIVHYCKNSEDRYEMILIWVKAVDYCTKFFKSLQSSNRDISKRFLLQEYIVVSRELR